MRKIEGLMWARRLEKKPANIPTSRLLRGAKAAGLRYERSLAKFLPTALHGPWYEYADQNGHGICHPDFVLDYLPKVLMVIEVKYTLVEEAFYKLMGLYLPVVRLASKKPVVGIVLVKNLKAHYFQEAQPDLLSAAAVAQATGFPSIVQWVGQPLLPPKLSYAA